MTALKNMMESHANNVATQISGITTRLGNLETVENARTACFNMTGESHIYWPSHTQADSNGCLAVSRLVAGQGIGVGQNWQNVSASRVADVAYRNTTGRSIMVSVHILNLPDSRLEVSSDGVNWDFILHGNPYTGSVIIPDQHYSRVTRAYYPGRWLELR